MPSLATYPDAVASEFPVSRLPAVNVASVPQRSPLRYPGGKTWLIPHIRDWLRTAKPEILIEPFAGGGIVSLTAVMEELVDQAVMVEIDHDVAAFWHAALRNGKQMADTIQKFLPTRETLCEWETSRPRSVNEHGFRTLVFNRTRRGGILAAGASYMKQGENGRGILSRWYPATLARRLAEIERHESKLIFCEGNGMKLLPVLLRGWEERAAVFLDPPYTAGGKRAGRRLYTDHQVDHAKLFSILASSDADFLMTYDLSPEIVELVQHHGFHAVSVVMKNTHHNRMAEIIITRESLFV